MSGAYIVRVAHVPLMSVRRRLVSNDKNPSQIPHGWLGAVAQKDARGAWHRDQTLPLSPGLDIHLNFDGRFAQRSVRVDIEHVEAFCGRWLNQSRIEACDSCADGCDYTGAPTMA